LAAALFAKNNRLPLIALSDRIFPCGMVLGALIRLGNFMNQEILGVQTDLPWGVIFSNPSSIVSFGIYPRHPVQIYESFFYIFLAFLGIYMLYRSAPTGRVSAFLGFLLFFGRFLIEFLKEEQSLYTQQMFINMGQALSIPLMVIALVALAYTYRQPQKNQ
jgi:prolipoprotein diacylglyceryltransferase